MSELLDAFISEHLGGSLFSAPRAALDIIMSDFSLAQPHPGAVLRRGVSGAIMHLLGAIFLLTGSGFKLIVSFKKGCFCYYNASQMGTFLTHWLWF